MRAAAAAFLVAPACARGAGQSIVEIFPGYGNPRTLWVSGRVCEAPRGGWWGLGALANIFPGSVEGGDVTLRAGAVRAKARAGGGGYFSSSLQAAPGMPWAGAVKVSAVSAGNEEFHGTAYVPSPTSRTGLISGIEETIMTTPAAPGDASGGDGPAGRPVPGMAELYTRFAAWGTKRARPVCYVSAFPDPLTAGTAGFLSINRFPPGPLMLMRPGEPGAGAAPVPLRVYDHTLTAIQNALAAWPEKKFVLFGCAGGDDPEIYRCIAVQYRTRIRGVYLRRSGGRDPERERGYPGFVFFDAAEEVAKDLARKGIIAEK